MTSSMIATRRFERIRMQPDEIHRKKAIVALLLAYGMTGTALACSPLPEEKYASTEKRVRERYTLAESIELATIVDEVNKSRTIS